MSSEFKNITDKAVRVIGNVSAVSRLFGFRSSQSVANWIARNKVPSSRVIKLCELGKWRVTPHELRPDLYPDPVHGIPAEVNKGDNKGAEQ
ncbi:TPA: helix-turn-helix domain-containing protein [Escherichia coli]|uniref:transcriptional regulator n=1 Tax=Escherichia coli TaxID=562 RepID=UPI001B1EAB68|nr:YdaS family helix-turn-helix protein [Escherichia coli]EFN2531274.1 helix-turn-helix domain-containing protein [Escherichia coli]EHS6039243.1 helix-turn-helix domain-containing protein [Escherichia coli]EKR1239553.1 helix-turn-helix domain-containing protein [Escherichia coli]MCQ1715225.1 helix-turn-helix domain-containing protein [Escherichia coli]HBA9006179.1 helix-turn-helix domain-containing protein [Escherichia coli]